MSENAHSKFRTVTMAHIALFSVLIAVCSWISIPAAVPFTLQTFAVFCTVGFLGGKRGALSVVVYIMLGAAGIPVFAGFTGGAGAIFGPAGGYIVGFVFLALVYWLITGLFGNNTLTTVIAMTLGLLVLYAFGTAWFMAVYTRSTGHIGFLAALCSCVFPFIIPDLIKMALAILFVKRLAPHLKHLQ